MELWLFNCYICCYYQMTFGKILKNYVSKCSVCNVFSVFIQEHHIIHTIILNDTIMAASHNVSIYNCARLGTKNMLIVFCLPFVIIVDKHCLNTCSSNLSMAHVWIIDVIYPVVCYHLSCIIGRLLSVLVLVSVGWHCLLSLC